MYHYNIKGYCTHLCVTMFINKGFLETKEMCLLHGINHFMIESSHAMFIILYLYMYMRGWMHIKKSNIMWMYHYIISLYLKVGTWKWENGAGERLTIFDAT